MRPKIVNCRPTPQLDDMTCEIHALTSRKDWLNLAWALSSFYHFSGKRYALSIHDDGTLRTNDVKKLKSLFPAARVLDSADSRRSVLNSLQGFENCFRLRSGSILSKKLFDFQYHLRSDQLMLLDSDVLFFSKPDALISRIESSTDSRTLVNADVETRLNLSSEYAQSHFDIELCERFNSGLGIIPRSAIRLEDVELFLTAPGISRDSWLIEQTLYALCCSKYGADLLPPDYDLNLDVAYSPRIVRHYVGSIRQQMYTQGIKHLADELLRNDR